MKNNGLPAPRKLMRSVARAKMRRAGLRKVNRTHFHFFANNWREYAVMRERYEPGEAGYPIRRGRS